MAIYKNKKGTQITDPMVLLIIISMLGMLTFGWFLFSSQVATNPNSNLDEASILYIAEHSGYEVNNKDFGEDLLTEEQFTSSFYTQNNNATSSDKDYALEFLYYREQSSGWRDTVNNLYGMPTFFLGAYGFDLSAWAFVVHGLNLIIWGIIFFIVYKIIRGIIK